MKFKFSLSILAELLMAITAVAQEQPKPRSILSNEDVVDMVKSGQTASLTL